MKYPHFLFFFCIHLSFVDVSSIGLIGCKFGKKLCSEFESCIEDNPFGSCVDTKTNNVIPSFNYSASQLALLGTVLNQLASAGFTWTHLYTQCKLHYLLLSFKENKLTSKDYCSEAVRQVNQNKTFMEDNKIEKKINISDSFIPTNKDKFKSTSISPDNLIKEFYISQKDLSLLKDYVLNLNSDDLIQIKLHFNGGTVLNTVENDAANDSTTSIPNLQNIFPDIELLNKSYILKQRNKYNKSLNRMTDIKSIMLAQGNNEPTDDHIRRKLLAVVYILIILALLLTSVLVILLLVWRRMRMIDWEKFKSDTGDYQSDEYQELCRENVRVNSSKVESMPISKTAIYSDIHNLQNNFNVNENI